ncbi:MAG: DUF4350 domain-containing protein [Blastocatellia bacterium]
MRSPMGLILTAMVVVLIFVALSAARYVTFDRPAESEASPNRSTYNSGPTGIKAFYQVLENSGRPVGRWRQSFRQLELDSSHTALVMVGPFDHSTLRDSEEIRALERWISNGGQLLLISRDLQFSLRGGPLRMSAPAVPSGEAAVDPDGDRYILQPTRITRGLRGLALTHLASRLQVDPLPLAADDRLSRDENSVPESDQETPLDDLVGPFAAPITHLGDDDGAILLDFNFGAGRVLLLTDPFVVANNGISRGANLDLALNLIGEIYESGGNSQQLILFDEYHHGYRNDTNPLITLLRGTPWPLIMFQAVLFMVLLGHQLSRRFTRPLPLPAIDRHSPLEFVDSMAGLQQAAEARDLAVENIYPRFRSRLCRYLGLSTQARDEEIFTRLARLKPEVANDQLRQTLAECELILEGQPVTDQQLVRIIGSLRSVDAALPRTGMGLHRDG